MALPPWSERTKDVSGPKTMNPYDYTSDVQLGNASPTNIQARIYNTPGNTPLNRAQGGLLELPGRYSEGDWQDSWFKGSQANY